MIENAKDILNKAKVSKFAVPHFNVLDANIIKGVMEEAEKNDVGIYIAISEKSINFIGGYKTFSNLVRNIDNELKIKVPIIIHLDHGTYDQCVKAIDSGFTSVMFDGSKLPIEENIEKSKKIVELAKKNNVSVEAEVGSIGGEEDGIIGTGEKSNIDDCLKMQSTNIDSLAIGINTIHGKYPNNWEGVDFDLLEEINNKLTIPLVMHGGSGIPEEQIKKSIKIGISKFNVGTSLQQRYGNGVEDYINNVKKNQDEKWYDPRKIVQSGLNSIKTQVKETIKMLGK